MKRYPQCLILSLAGLLSLNGGVGLVYINEGDPLDAWLLALLGLVLMGRAWAGLSPTQHALMGFADGLARKWYRWGYVILLAVALGAVNFVATQFSWQWDLTQARQHTLHGSTKELLGTLDAPVEIVAFYPGLPPKYLEDLFAQYARAAQGRVHTEILDPLVEISRAAAFDTVIRSRAHKVIVRNARGQQEIDFTDRRLTENELNNLILRLARRQRKVYFLTGHGEANIYDEEEKGFSQWKGLLEANNLRTARLLIGAHGQIPEDCDVLVIAGPKKALSGEEVAAVDAFLRRGGDVLFLIEHTVITTPDRPLPEGDVDRHPSLNRLLNRWGLQVSQDVVIDAASHVSGDVGSPATRNYLKHRAIVGDLDYTFYVRPRSISMLARRRPTIKLAPLVLTESTTQSWGETNRMLQIKFDEGVDRPGPVPIAFVGWEPKTAGDLSDTRLVVITDTDFLTNVFIDQFSNAQLGLNAVNWLSEVDYKMFIPTPDVTQEVARLDLTSRQKRGVLVLLALVPMCIVALGMAVWIKQQAV